jgi:hypothetical protein
MLLKVYLLTDAARNAVAIHAVSAAAATYTAHM